MNSIADALCKTSVEKRCSRLRGNILFGVEASVAHASKSPTNGPRHVRKKETRYPPQGNAAPLMVSERAYPSEVLAI
jgi:hypothetical protein